MIDGAMRAGSLAGPPIFLFNLEQDIGERNDLIKEHSEIARRLRPLLTAWEKDVDAEAAAKKEGG